MNIHMTDPDNRDGRGASFELEGSADRVVKYLDGPLRRDTLGSAHFYIDATIAALLAGGIGEATTMARQVGVYLTEITGELPEVIDLGEDFDQWFVTGTSDAHSAELAVRKYWTTVLDEDEYNAMFDDYDLGSLGLEFRKDWAWKHPAGWPPEREPEDDSRLVCAEDGNGLPRFAGYMVKL